MEQRALKNPESNVNVKIHTCPEVAFPIEHKSDAHYVSWKFSPGHSLPWEKVVVNYLITHSTESKHSQVHPETTDGQSKQEFAVKLQAMFSS